MKHIVNTLLGTSLLVLASSASAGGEVHLKPHESKGWMNAIGRIGGYYSRISSEYPRTDTATRTLETGKASRSGIGFDLDLMGFWDATRFDTLLGAEMKLQIALIKGDDVQRDGTVVADANKLFFRWDAAFDYGLFHFGTAKGVRGRLAGGAGFGADYDGGRPGVSSGRVYPLLLARAHLFLTDDLGGHLAYHYVPTTTSDIKIREHRFEVAGSLSSLQAGIRYVLTRNYAGDTPYDTTEASVFVAYAF